MKRLSNLFKYIPKKKDDDDYYFIIIISIILLSKRNIMPFVVIQNTYLDIIMFALIKIFIPSIIFSPPSSSLEKEGRQHVNPFSSLFSFFVPSSFSWRKSRISSSFLSLFLRPKSSIKKWWYQPLWLEVKKSLKAKEDFPIKQKLSKMINREE